VRSGIMGEKDNMATMHDVLDAQVLFVHGSAQSRLQMLMHTNEHFWCRPHVEL